MRLSKLRRWYAKKGDDIRYGVKAFFVIVFAVLACIVVIMFDKSI